MIALTFEGDYKKMSSLYDISISINKTGAISALPKPSLVEESAERVVKDLNNKKDKEDEDEDEEEDKALDKKALVEGIAALKISDNNND